MRTKEVKHIAGDGTETTFTRLFADEGKVLTNGTDFFNCVDVQSADGWSEIDAPAEDEETPEIDPELAAKAEAYDILMGGDSE